MRILYITEQDLNNNSGVSLKVKGQVLAWTQSGHRVEIVNLFSFEETSSEKFPRFTRLLSLWINSFHLYRKIKRSNYELIYARFFPWTYFWHLISIEVPVIFEVNGDEDAELKKRSIFAYIYNLLTRRFSFLSCRGLVSVSQELSLKYKHLNIPIKVLGNGYEQAELIPADLSEKISLCFVGNMRDCHGIDKIVFLASQNPDFIFHLIGNIDLKNPPPGIKLHGPQNADYVRKILSQCHVGISSLALDRIPLKEASPLKSREYLSQGLPVIYAYEDTDLPENLPFTLMLPQGEENVSNNALKVRKFILRCASDTALRTQARRFFVENLTYDAKEVNRLGFFQDILRRKVKV